MRPEEFYETRAQEFRERVRALKKRFVALATLRLAVFLVMVISVYLLWNQLPWVILAAASGLSAFLFLVARATDVRRQQRYAEEMVTIQEIELEALQGNFHRLNTGAAHLDNAHPYNQDIDLFGPGSLFQQLNRTETPGGELLLATWLNSNHIDRVPEKQQVVRELSGKPEWRQHFRASATLIKTRIPSGKVLQWLRNYAPFAPKVFRWLPPVFGMISLTGLILLSLSVIPWQWLAGWFFVGLAISGPYVKRITRLYNEGNAMKETLSQFSVLLKAIEEETFQTPEIQKRQDTIRTAEESASGLLKRLARYIDYLGNRNNFLFAPLANGFMLWDLWFTVKIDDWFKRFDRSVEHWFDTIEYLDAANSLANYAFNHPEFVYPKVAAHPDNLLNATQLGHPMIPRERAVTNNVHISNGQFFIVTGANMAGKSTFLRTISLSIVMANCGLPVCASTFEYSPVKLISSMRTSDSLQNDESYFFSELKRLKFIVESLESDRYFIVLDEILKGTNSKDKAEGSWKFVERLLDTGSTGIIATHDLSLCDLSARYPQVRNYCFDATIENDELFFDYTFREGVCKNMNASFLLHKMNIIR